MADTAIERFKKLYTQCNEPPIDILPTDLGIETFSSTSVDNLQFYGNEIKEVHYEYLTTPNTSGTLPTGMSYFKQWADDIHGNRVEFDDITQSWRQTIWAKPLTVPSQIKCTHVPKGFRVSPTINCPECQTLEDSIGTASKLALKHKKEMELREKRQTYKIWDCFHMLDDESDKIVKNYCDACKCRNDTNVGLG